MTTPIGDFVKKYAESDTSRFHMPGHKGKAFLGCESLDITEITGADVLSSADGIIAESEKNASALFKSKYSFYSAEGSTLAIKAMLELIKNRAVGSKTARILASRNAHKAFIYACALLDIDVQWLYPKNSTHLCSCNISAEELSAALSSGSSLPSAVYVTSPDYLGNILDIKGLAEVCHSYGLPLLVDNAHGAYLAFLNKTEHPIALGADMCCDSAHKTLPVLTGGAYLHVGQNYAVSPDEVRSAMALFSSTSPSYLILQSLDMCNAYLANGYREKLAGCIESTRVLKRELCRLGFPAEDGEELKIVISRAACGYSGEELARHLRLYNVEAEFADRDLLVLMVTPELGERDFNRVTDAFAALTPRAPDGHHSASPLPTRPTVLMPIRKAMLSPFETVPVAKALGRICASPTVSCPPAVPIVMSGELIDGDTAELLKYYGVNKVNVIK